MTTHTPAPWTIQSIETNRHGYDWPTFAIRDGKTNVCLAIVGEVDHWTAKSNAANATLIAAAPELLEALEALLEDVEFAQPQIESGLIGNRQIRHARAAIAKARGE